jgi:uncharacterized protein (TIGR03083 family)
VAGLDFLGLLEHEVQAMGDAIAGADPAAAVPGCPGWVVRDVVTHLVGVHSWVTATLGQEQPAAYAEEPLEGDGQQLAGRYREVAQALLGRMRELPADAPSWSFDAADRTAGYWRRRQLHEVSVHRWDVAPYAMDEAVAADGVDEVVDFFIGRQVERGRATLPEGSLRLVGPERTWTVGTGQPVASVEGRTGNLLLALWGRKDLLPEPWRDAKLLP